MEINYFSKDNYEELSGWWKKHQHNIIPFSSLPIGVVVSKDGKNLAMSFVYTMDGCDIAQLAWTTSNPENSPRQSYEAIDLAIDAILKVANEKLNKKMIVCFSSSKGLTKILNKKNLTKNVEHILHMGSY